MAGDISACPRRTLAPSLSAGTTTENRSGSGGETSHFAHSVVSDRSRRRRRRRRLSAYAGHGTVRLTHSCAPRCARRPLECPPNTTTGRAPGI